MKLTDWMHTIYFNLRVFDFKTAVKLPVYVGSKITIKNISKGCISIPDNISRGMISIGVNLGSSGLRGEKETGCIDVENGSQIVLGRNVIITAGGVLKAINNSRIEIGDNFYANPRLTLLAKKHISIGNDVMMGWNCLINDGDGHSIYDKQTNKQINDNEDVVISDNVWIGAEVTLLKGTFILKNSIVGYGSLVTRKYDKENVVIAGRPAGIIKENVYWKR